MTQLSRNVAAICRSSSDQWEHYPKSLMARQTLFKLVWLCINTLPAEGWGFRNSAESIITKLGCFICMGLVIGGLICINSKASIMWWLSLQWASYQKRKISGCACATNAGNVFPATPRVSDPGMHHGTCVTHVPWCMPGSLTSAFLWIRWRGKRPDIPGACAIRKFTYLVRGPLRRGEQIQTRLWVSILFSCIILSFNSL